ncbi:hypothetical protein [Actinoplanes regularis]|uniref:hypothetical protein n=1 Tax=Actinoplanes regularis TaxID=52697 RepID=UPI0024A28C0A|nr:hypothetical protein [Actinoplanes regularis]GLW28687.1 hypothetical protein Areg01_16270 [Actinoplanes regularis]
MSQDPYAGQPFPGVPNPNVPSHDPAPDQPPTLPFTPAYAQPTPDQAQPAPGYPPPAPGYSGYPQPAYGAPGFPPPAPPKKSRTLLIVLLSVAIALVLCVGGLAVVGLLAKKNDDDKKAAAAKITVVEPVTLGGREKLESAEFTEVTKTMKAGLLKDYPGATQSVGAFYGEPAKKDMVMAIAVAAPIPNPKLELNKNFTNLTLTGITAENVADVDAGPLGGVAKCGDSSISGMDVAICAWTDDGSVGVVFFYNATKSTTQKEFISLRSELEKTS